MPKKAAKKAAAKKPKKKAPASPQKLVAELMREFEKRLGPNELIMPADVEAMLASLNGPLPTEGLSDEEADARDEAQQIALDAMEAETEAEARKLAKRALRLDPDCVDALVVMTDLDARTMREAIEGLQKAVAAGERSLGEKFIRENKGHFWMLLDTRPYMRALQSLGEAYRSAGVNLDAIKIYEKMLELNPNDNQGVRDPLLGLYLETGDLKGAAGVLKKYKEDASANFAWARVLERFMAGDRDGASTALKAARKSNRHVELLLTQKQALPKELPDMYAPGSAEEAVLCLSFLSGALTEHAEVSSWLFDQFAADGVLPPPSEAKLKRMAIARKSVQ
ncbi:MAG TPA: hypothetical protein VMA34_19400 [Terracidiphilus sp.]|nr:hypothetical protein [Terracidiphilus sp.]